MGADHTVHVDTRDAQALAERVKSTLGGDADVTIECSGAESSIQTGIYVCTYVYIFADISPFYRHLKEEVTLNDG